MTPVLMRIQPLTIKVQGKYMCAQCIESSKCIHMLHMIFSYRKIPGDVCTGGDESLYAPFEAECCREGKLLCNYITHTNAYRNATIHYVYRILFACLVTNNCVIIDTKYKTLGQ